MNSFRSLARLSPTLLALGMLSPGLATAQDALPPSVSPALEQAAQNFAASHLALAQAQFETVAGDPSAAPFIRGFGLLGAAETARARKDLARALTLWRRISQDLSLPKWQRDSAARQALAAERKAQGLPGWNAAAHRESLPALPPPATTLFVAPDGNDQAEGSQTRPFRTLQRARDAVRALKKSSAGVLPPGGIKISVAGGIYPVKTVLTLTAEDSGTAAAPVSYQARPGQRPVFTAGRPVRGWQTLSDAALLDKLDPAVRANVRVADLKANAILDWGDATALRHAPEFFADGLPQTLARWPNTGFVITGPILGTNHLTDGGIPGCKDGLFRFQEDRPLTWRDEPDVRLYGYWFWDWFEEFQKVAAIDSARHSFVLAQPYSNYGYRPGQRYYALNVFRELDQPGEWYLDRREGKLYWLPPPQAVLNSIDTVLSTCEEPFIVLDHASHILLLGLTFQEGRGDAIHIQGGADCLLAGCTLQRFGGDAVVIDGGQRHGVFGCLMRTLGCGGVRANGGDRQTLAPGGHFVENCTVSDISRLKRTYTPAVLLEGCGNRVAHNLFQQMPSSALRLEGNDHLVELNRIRRVVQESDDQGGLDMYGKPLFRGVVIRWNYWSDIQGGTKCGAAGVRLDDMISGVVVQGNLFERCGALLFGAIQVHGGMDNALDGNLFLDCPAAVSFSPWDLARWARGLEPFRQQARSPLYASRYPDLARLTQAPNVNFVTRNLFVNCPSIFLRAANHEQSALNQTAQPPLPSEALAQAGQAPTLRRLLLETIPLDDIGPYPHPWAF